MYNDKEPEMEERSDEIENENEKNKDMKDQEGASQVDDSTRRAEAENAIENDFEKLQKHLSESESLLGTYKDQLLRLAAEFENYKKRVEADKVEFIKFSNEKIIKELLPILDDFERALANRKLKSETMEQNSEQTGESFYKGVELIYQKLSKMLDDNGVKPMESIGKEFDVSYHDVLMQVPRDNVMPHNIVEEVERGYTLHGKVIKHAKVIVAAPSKEKSQVTDDGEETGSHHQKKN